MAVFDAPLADLIEYFEPHRLGTLHRWLARAGGVVDPDGQTPRDLRLTFTGHEAEPRACLERMMARAPEREFLTHGRWYRQDGAQALRRAFRWLGVA